MDLEEEKKWGKNTLQYIQEDEVWILYKKGLEWKLLLRDIENVEWFKLEQLFW